MRLVLLFSLAAWLVILAFTYAIYYVLSGRVG